MRIEDSVESAKPQAAINQPPLTAGSVLLRILRLRSCCRWRIRRPTAHSACGTIRASAGDDDDDRCAQVADRCAVGQLDRQLIATGQLLGHCKQLYAHFHDTTNGLLPERTSSATSGISP